MKFLPLVLMVLLAGCAPPASPKTEAPATGSPNGGSISDAICLSVDGVPGVFSSQTAAGPHLDFASLKTWYLVQVPTNPMTAHQVWTSMLLQTGGKSLLDPTLSAADITSAQLDITWAVDATHAAGWTLSVANPASVSGAHFTFSNTGGKISTHFEGTGTVKSTNSGLVAAAPALVFQAADLPGGLVSWP